MEGGSNKSDGLETTRGVGVDARGHRDGVEALDDPEVRAVQDDIRARLDGSETSLDQMETLTLSGADFRHLTECEGPSPFGSLSRLRELRLHGFSTDDVNVLLGQLPSLHALDYLSIERSELYEFPQMLYRLTAPTRVFLPKQFCGNPEQFQFLLDLANPNPLPTNNEYRSEPLEGDLPKQFTQVGNAISHPDHAIAGQGFELLVSLIDTEEVRRMFEVLLYSCRIDADGRLQNLDFPSMSPVTILRLMTHAPDGIVIHPALIPERITRLCLSTNTIQFPSPPPDFNLLSRFSALTALNLAWSHFAVEDIETALMALPCPEKLTDLNVSSNSLTRIPKGLDRLTNLTRLNLWSTKSTASMADDVIDALPHPEKLTDLNLGGNVMSAVSARLDRLSGLTSLNLANMNLTSEQLEEWINGLAHPERLRRIRLDLNPNLGDPPDAFARLTGLRDLQLDVDNITPWLQAIPHPDRVTTLRLYQLPSDTDIALFTGLESLYLTGLGEDHGILIPGLQDTLSSPERFKTLALTHSALPLGPPHIQHLPHLERVDLRHNFHLNPGDLIKLFQPSIRELDCRYNNIRGLIDLKAFDALSPGTVIDLRSNPITSPDLFRRALRPHLNALIELVHEKEIRFRFV